MYLIIFLKLIRRSNKIKYQLELRPVDDWSPTCSQFLFHGSQPTRTTSLLSTLSRVTRYS